jgi:hypothetical protein
VITSTLYPRHGYNARRALPWSAAARHRIGDPDAARAEHRAPLQAHIDRFDLHAGLTIAAKHAHGRLALEKLLRYCARPTPWADGATHVIYEPLDLIAKLAALIPRPYKNPVTNSVRVEGSKASRRTTVTSPIIYKSNHILFFASLAFAGCAHSQARCDRRPASAEEPPAGAPASERDWYLQREVVLREVRELYAKGERRFEANGQDQGDATFMSIVDLVYYQAGAGELLYEQLEDGHWVFSVRRPHASVRPGCVPVCDSFLE